MREPEDCGPQTLAKRVHADVISFAERLLRAPEISGREDVARAQGIIRRLATAPETEEIWRTLTRRNRSGDAVGDFHHGPVETDDARSKRVIELFEKACLAAVWRFETKTGEELDAAHAERLRVGLAAAAFAPDLSAQMVERAHQLREPPEYRLRVERRRTDVELKGYVITMSGVCAHLFGSEMPAIVARMASAALGVKVTQSRAREMLRDVPGRG